MNMLRDVVLLTLIAAGQSLEINGCPLFGCRLSGTFSLYLNIPRGQATVAWETSFIMDAVPIVLGCVANQVNIVCQSNGIFKTDKGYVVLNITDGSVKWRDSVLHFPTLPLLDNYGDVTGSDGNSLVHYDQLGNLFPIIHLLDMKPVYSMAIVGTAYYLMVSELGGISIRDLDAIPDSYIFLNATIQRVNGTFIPVCQPVVNGNRFYLLTEFVPTSQNEQNRNVLNMQRLYALDVHDRMADVVTVAWFYDFEREQVKQHNSHRYREETHNEMNGGQPINVNEDDRLKFQPNKQHSEERLLDQNRIKQYLLWDNYTEIVYVILPPPSLLTASGMTTFWAMKDTLNDTKVVFRSDNVVTHMALFETNSFSSEAKQQVMNYNRILWTTSVESTIIGLRTEDQSVYKTIDISAILKAEVTITSKMAAVRSTDKDPDVLVIGIRTGPTTPATWDVLLSFGIKDTDATFFVIAVDTAADVAVNTIRWMVAVPGNMEVLGQIAGAAGAASRVKDGLVMYVEERGKTAKCISIH